MSYQEAVIAVVKIAASAAEKAKENGKHKEILEAIEQAKAEIIDAIVDIRNSELKGMVRGQLIEFEQFTKFDKNRLSRFVSDSNKIIGQIEQGILDRDLKSDNEIIPAYTTIVTLTYLAMLHLQDSHANTINRAVRLCQNFRRECSDSVSGHWSFSKDSNRNYLYGGSSISDHKVVEATSWEELTDWALSATSYSLAGEFTTIANQYWLHA